MSSIYDVFRGVQAQKTSCYDERSAAFINEGALSTNITHIRRNTVIKAAVTFNDKEGADDVIVFTQLTDQLLKTDYFTYNGVYYLVYEDVKLTDQDLKYKKQRAVECNINFSVNGTFYNAYFLSSLRKWNEPEFVKNMIVVPEHGSLIIIPTNVIFEEGLIFKIGTKSWKIIDFDNLSNAGITYLYVEQAYTATTSTTPLTPDVPALLTLNPMVEYTFITKDAYFASNPRVNVIERKTTSVKFVVPIGITSVSISRKNESSVVISENYTVVL